MIVLIVDSSSSLNQSSTDFGACSNLELASGRERTSRACPNADVWNTNSTTKIDATTSLLLRDRAANGVCIIFNLPNGLGHSCTTFALRYGFCGMFSASVLGLPI